MTNNEIKQEQGPYRIEFTEVKTTLTQRIYIGIYWLLRALLWTLFLFVLVVGLKVLWIAVLYMWNLV